ncbi:DUF7333 family protein [Natrialba asiatica]|uniref:Uncharacterized protein n=1 Tax=Natrialba asiatica (strain ATCC 700177 / DSM 12278 / JCM 9576 / FERM P-10747 / NBRC 102637 / 172P1) TaxID=29540 RepID=M0AWJ6_NATA1|nr:hypothetical protein [Natrialba asiatica]ELZ02702.1 hypothetical protein C481_08541 [Natrialba asiatica DSM 12278]
MALDLPKTVGAFVLIVAIGTAAMVMMPVSMGTDTILMMVTPSMAVFGAIMLAIGVKHGEYRATN